MRISDWSSDVCSSDLRGAPRTGVDAAAVALVDAAVTGAEPPVVGGAPGQCRHQRSIRSSELYITRQTIAPSAARASAPVATGWRRAARCASSPRYAACLPAARIRSEEHTSELQSLMRISYAVF